MKESNHRVTDGGEVMTAVSPTPENEVEPSIDREPARVFESPNGEVIGVDIHLTADDLKKLGILPSGTESVMPVVRNGAILVEPVQ